jgi:hypothetical protein
MFDEITTSTYFPDDAEPMLDRQTPKGVADGGSDGECAFHDQYTNTRRRGTQTKNPEILLIPY